MVFVCPDWYRRCVGRVRKALLKSDVHLVCIYGNPMSDLLSKQRDLHGDVSRGSGRVGRSVMTKYTLLKQTYADFCMLAVTFVKTLRCSEALEIVSHKRLLFINKAM